MQDLADVGAVGKTVAFHLEGQVPEQADPSMPPEAWQNLIKLHGTPPAIPPPTGLFSADVTVPVLTARAAEPNQTRMLEGRTITLQRVVVSPSQMDIFLGGSALGSGRTVESFAVNGLSPGPSNAISVAGQRLPGGTTVISFGYPDYAHTGEWTITIGPLVDYSVPGPPPTTLVISPDNSVTFHFTLPSAP